MSAWAPSCWSRPLPSCPTRPECRRFIKTTPSAAEPSQGVNEDTNRPGVLVKIPLPVDSKSAAQIRQTLKRIGEKAPQVVRLEDRQVIVLEFDTSGGKTGLGSELEACQSLARFLGSSEMNRVETVAYIPADSRNIEGGSVS